MIENDQADEPLRNGLSMSEILQDERISVMLSAYLDGALEGDDLQYFKRLLLQDENLAREVEEMLRVEGQLKLLGADILDEPIPAELLDVLQGKVGQ
jgi:anti-sigma factor RsiW